MAAARADTEGGFNEFIRQQCEAPGSATVTLAQFDDQYELVYADVPVRVVPPLVLEPAGRTALLDGIGRLTTDIGEKLRALPEDDRPGKVIIVVFTDGHENASREWNLDAVNTLVRQQQEQWGWTYLFLGATLDAIDTAATMGITRSHAMSYNKAQTQSTFDAVATATRGARDGTFLGFTEADRRAAGGGDPDGGA
jgi:hypothetical protein